MTKRKSSCGDEWQPWLHDQAHVEDETHIIENDQMRQRYADRNKRRTWYCSDTLKGDNTLRFCYPCKSWLYVRKGYCLNEKCPRYANNSNNFTEGKWTDKDKEAPSWQMPDMHKLMPTNEIKDGQSNADGDQVSSKSKVDGDANDAFSARGMPAFVDPTEEPAAFASANTTAQASSCSNAAAWEDAHKYNDAASCEDTHDKSWNKYSTQTSYDAKGPSCIEIDYNDL